MARRLSRFAGLAAVHLIAATAAGSIASAQEAGQQSDTAQLSVSATIAQVCEISDVGSINFGQVPSDEDKDAQTVLTLQCAFAGDQDVTVDINMGLYPESGLRHMRKAGSTNDIGYIVCEDANCETEWTAPVSHTISNGESQLTVYARILAFQLTSDFEAGEYTDTLTVTLSY